VFELAGLLFNIALLFAVSAVIGCLYALLARVILRPRPRRRRYVVLAALLPPFFAAWVIACAIVFAAGVPGEGATIFFGDVSEPLPNGYVLKATGKRPGDAWIQANSKPSAVVSGIGAIEVSAPFVFGAYARADDRADPNQPEAGRVYFALDTRDAGNRVFGNLDELNGYAGRRVHLVRPEQFRSSDPAHRRRTRIERVIWFAPPAVLTVAYLLFLLRIRATPG